MLLELGTARSLHVKKDLPSVARFERIYLCLHFSYVSWQTIHIIICVYLIMYVNCNKGS